MAEQPDLRSFIVYDIMPSGCFAHPICDEQTMPHIRPGECAIVDPEQHEPIEGELFLIAWPARYDDDPPRLAIVETSTRIGGGQRWGLARCAPQVFQAVGGGATSFPPTRMWDFPYTEDLLTRRLVGRVVGILAPSFEEPKRIGGGHA